MTFIHKFKVTGPLFKWFGSKWLASKLYPKPQYEQIFEPYAGSAGYSLRHQSHDVTIWEKDPNLWHLWHWLINYATYELVREIPLNLPEGTNILSLGLKPGQELLLKHWQRTNNVGDCWTISSWGNKPGGWTENTRDRVSEEIGAVKHWKLEQPMWNVEATYFFDPPYLFNYGYRFPGSFDHSEMTKIVQSVKGQVIVCEAVCQKTGQLPDYLPFRHFARRITSRRKATENHHSKELIYVR